MPHLFNDDFWEAADKLPLSVPPLFVDTEEDENHNYLTF